MSSISGTGGQAMLNQAMGAMRGGHHHRDADALSANLFQQLDTAGQGFIQKSDLTAALDKVPGDSALGVRAKAASSGVDQFFAALDTDGDGKVTRQEFTTGVDKIHSALEQQFSRARVEFGMPGGTPALQGGDDDDGFTREQLGAQLTTGGAGDDRRSALLTKLVQNFDQADANGDGKVSRREAMAFDKTNAASAGGAAALAEAQQGSSDLVLQIMKLMQVYGEPQQQAAHSNALSAMA